MRSLFTSLLNVFKNEIKVGAISFEVIHYDKISIQTWIQFGFSIFYHFIPFKSEVVNKCCMKEGDSHDFHSEIVYDQCKFEFVTVILFIYNYS